MADLSSLKGVSESDRRMIADAEAMLGPEPSAMGFAKNLFWGRLRSELLFPYPSADPDETARCDALLAKLDEYLQNEHPAIQVDQEQRIPRWCVDRLFEIGVMGMIIPREFGGGGFGVTSYNRALERIGRTCGSTAVMVSAHQSIGCKAIVLFGTEEQKRRWLPMLATKSLSAFCLSEPNVGCDAGGQQTRCTVAPDGQHFILNGEKKWATSGALSDVFTVMCKQAVTDPKTGKTTDRVTALVCTPDMGGIDIFQKNRSKCGIRGTWQARIRFKDVRVPRANLLGQEGRGLNVALTCLNYGRCTLSAGMLGGAKAAFEQAVKWAQTRYQFERPLADFELVKQMIARMAARCRAMEAMLYATTAMLDRHDDDIMVETAICKVFCSEQGWNVVNDAVQIMGGEGYMTENVVERILRDSRINLIVEGANEVMRSFIFAYGGKQLAERLLGIRQAVAWDHHDSVGHNLGRIFRTLKTPGFFGAAASVGAEVFLGVRRHVPDAPDVHPSLEAHAHALAHAVREHSHAFIKASRHYEEAIVTRQAVQARLADSAIYLHAWACVLSRLDADFRAGRSGPAFEQGRAASLYFMDTARRQVRESLDALFHHDDAAMLAAADATLAHFATLPNDQFAIHEASPNARGTGRPVDTAHIPQFRGDQHSGSGANGNGAHERGVGFQPASQSSSNPADDEILPELTTRLQL
ncbi:MAG TPA: acyl-CoA dehydrogenase family protein [Tepidisphaeraceae bacterium]|nr:acyl-CoA dehydrogenase family protein [Tepidisphaeraceae bacterium]